VSEHEVVEGAPADRLWLVRAEREQGPSLRVGGEIDVFTAPTLAASLAELTATPSARVEIDLDGVTFIDSTGLRVLIEADRRMRDRESVLALVRPSRAVSRLLELTALGDWLTVEPSSVPGS
jgi:anti-sigma B factor antagonist